MARRAIGDLSGVVTSTKPIAALRQTGRRVERSRWVDRLARYGLACRAGVYLLMAAVAALLGFRRWGGEADQQGALASLTRHTGGALIVAALAAGFACLALWQALLAAGRPSGGAEGGSARLMAAAKAVAYAGLAASAASLAAGRRTGTGGAGATEDWTARIMRHPPGRVLVATLGVALVAGAAVLVVKGARGGFDVQVDIGRVGPRWGPWFDRLGRVGMMGRGVVVGLVGALLIDAAVAFDANRARGLDGALRSLARQPFGAWALLVLAAGLAAFGVFSALEARYAST